MWATPQLNYPVPVQHSKRTDASRKHASSPILCFRNTCNSSIDEHWRIKIKSLLNPSALILSITIPQVHLLHELCYVPMLLKHLLLTVFVSHSQSLQSHSSSSHFRLCLNFQHSRLLSHIPDSSIIFLLSMLKSPPTHSFRDVTERRHHQPHIILLC